MTSETHIRQWLNRQILGTVGSLCMLLAMGIYAATQWRTLLYWLTLFILAFCIAVALVATFEPLYDMMKWTGQ